MIRFKKPSGIYRIKSPSGYIYVGQSKNLKQRYGQYSRGSCEFQTRLLRSIEKHGWDKHHFEVCQYFDEVPEQSILDSREQYYMDRYREVGFELMNLKEAGKGGKFYPEGIKQRKDRSGPNNHMYGKAVSEETKRKLSESLKGRPGYWTGKHLSEETKLKLSISRKGKCCGPDHHAYGKKKTPEQLAKMSLLLKGKKLTGDQLEKARKNIAVIHVGNAWPIVAFRGEEIIEFACAPRAQEYFNTNNYTKFHFACKKGTELFGYHWKYKDK